MIAEEKINEAISTNEKVFLENLRTIMQIPSVKGSSEKVVAVKDLDIDFSEV